VHRTLVLPAYNEEEALPLLLRRASELGVVDDVLVIDDGSADRTAEVAQRPWGLPVRVVRHGRNRGLGAAMRTALGVVASGALDDDDVVITMDADNTHDPAIIPELCAAIGQADVVVASRFCPGGREFGLAWHRRLFSHGASLLLRWLRPVPGIRDYSCGYRAYRVGALRRMLAERGGPEGVVTTEGFACMAEILLRLHRSGARCAEVPLHLHYERKPGKSKMHIVRTIRGYLDILRAIPGTR